MARAAPRAIPLWSLVRLLPGAAGVGEHWGANNWLNNHTPNRFLGLPYTPLPSTHQNRF